MRLARAIAPRPCTDITTEQDHELAPGNVGMGQPPHGPPPAPRLKLVFKQVQSTREVHPAAAAAAAPASFSSALTHTSRTGRVVKAPTAFAPASAAATGKRKPGPRRKAANIVCVRCGRGNSPSSNQIVFCDGCNTTWHQMCHDPPIPGEVIEVKDKEWLCATCKPAPRPSTKAQSIKNAGRKAKAVQKAAPKVQRQPPRAPGLDVGGSQFTTHEQRAYLAAQSHAQLVGLVVRIAARNPDVPIFPVNLKELPASKFADQSTAQITTASSFSAPGPTSTNSNKRGRAVSATADDESEAGLARPSKRARTISDPAKPTTTETTTTLTAASPSRKLSAPTGRPASTKSTKTATSSASRLQSASAEPDLSRVSSPEESELETDEYDFEEIEDHRLYPRSGNGFTLSSDPADLSILDEDPESQTFSHRLHGPAKAAKHAKATEKTV